MGKSTRHNYPVYFLLLLLLYVGFQVECSSPLTSSSPNLTLSSHLKQCSALLQFKNTFVPCLHSFSLPSWVEGRDCCSWEGVKCDKVMGNVIGLDLSDTCLEGTINHNSSLFHLSHLQWLDFSSNNIRGSIPASIGNLTRLTELNFSSNSISGLLPSSLSNLQQLTHVVLSENMLTGQILDIFGNLSKLISLDLSFNNFNGFVKFDMLSKLENLNWIDVSYNSLPSFSFNNNINHTMPSLWYLGLSSCNISDFPSSLSSLESLKWLDLSKNNIHGRISITESKGWKGLIILNVSYNFLTSVDLYPWKKIIVLDLQNNMLQGSLLVPPPTTRVFSVSSNNLTGQIPPSICNLSSLEYLSLSNNNLSGTIPRCLGSSSIMLSILHLGNNNLQGRIPDTFASGIWLKSLDLNGNKLEGPLPRSLTNCSYLEVINVGNNKISDTFPIWLRNLAEIKVIVLRSNRFYGPIGDSKIIFSFSKLQIIDLSDNEFIGLLPRALFENMRAMMKVDEEDYKSGFLCVGDEYYQVCVTVTMKRHDIDMKQIVMTFGSIDLSNNGFEGEIPDILGNLKSLHVLNLSHNNLIDNIPLSLGQLTYLELLDLSSNKLDGRIPEQLTNLTRLSALNLSYNNFWGPIPQVGQFRAFESDCFIGNKGLCGGPLPEICSNDGAEEGDIADEFIWKIAMMGYGSGVVNGLSIGYIIFSTRKPQWLVRMVECGQKIVRRLYRRY